MTLGSLFDGSGGFPLAGAMHGITPVWASEIEPYPIKVTKARFPQMKHLGSVLDVDGAEVEPVDIITFGSPCQDLSVAGKRDGLHKGERSNLFFEAIRIITEMREATDGIYPRIAIWENVPGAYSSNKGEDFRAVLQAFCSIKDETADVPRPAAGKWNPAGAIVGNGWSVAWRTFDAQYWGVPQRRKRIYLIADFGSERAGKILFEQDRVRRDSAACGEAGQGAATDAEGSPRGGRECLTPWDVQSKRIYREDSKWPGLCTGKRICDGSVLISAADAERGVGGDCEIVGFQSSQSGFRLCATHATIDANNGSRRQNGVCYPAGDAEGSAGGSGVNCLTPHEAQPQRIYGVDGVYPAILANSNGGQNRQAICFQQNQREEVRSLGEQTGAIAANAGAHQTNYLCINANEQAVCYAASFMGGQGSNARSIAWTEEATPPLKSVPSGSNAVPDVCYAVRTRNTTANGWGGNNGPMVLETYTAGNGQTNQPLLKEQARTLDCMHDQQIVIEPDKPPRKYIIRRLTPLECCRLQGFPDWWEDGVQGSDSARYKMWGNGIALPNAEYVIGCAKELIEGKLPEVEG